MFNSLKVDDLVLAGLGPLAACGLAPVAGRGDAPPLRCAGFSCRGARAPGPPASAAAACGLSGCGPWA